MIFERPSAWLLLLLPLALTAWWRWSSVRRRSQLTHPRLDAMRVAGVTVRARARFIIPVLRMLGLALLVICIARPLKANERSRVFVDGIAIELVLDRSASMRNVDFVVDGRRMDRLSVVKGVVEDFVLGTEGRFGLRGRPDDLVGLVTFARFADSISPLTLDHEHLVNALRETTVASARSEDGTAIGEGVGLGVERLREVLERPGDPSRRIRSAVMIVLTDGENNAGEIDPLTAAELARAYGIRIYTIGVGNAFARVRGRRSRQPDATAITAAERTLRDMATVTGGQFFVARDAISLMRIYEQIDELERVETEQRRYRLTSDLAVERGTVAGWRLPPVLLVVFGILLTEAVLALTRLRSHA